MSTEQSRKLPRYEKCFVCGRGNGAGLDVQFWREGDVIRAEWTPQERHRGYLDRVHGGVVASILDEAMGWAPSHQVGRLFYSVEISVRYRRPVEIGRRFRVEGRMLENRRRLVRCEGRLLDEEGNVCASSSGTYVALPGGKTEEVLEYLYVEGDESRPVSIADF